MIVSVQGKSAAGFTLIELMVVVVIVAVLTMIAYPAYQSFTIKANRAEAESYLLDVAQKQQLYFNDSRSYAESADALNSEMPDRVASNYAVTFEITTTTPPPAFIISATPIAGTLQAGDGKLSISNNGEKLHGTESW